MYYARLVTEEERELMAEAPGSVDLSVLIRPRDDYAGEGRF